MFTGKKKRFLLEKNIANGVQDIPIEYSIEKSNRLKIYGILKNSKDQN